MAFFPPSVLISARLGVSIHHPMALADGRDGICPRNPPLALLWVPALVFQPPGIPLGPGSWHP